MSHWRAAHTLAAATSIGGWFTGCWPGGLVHEGLAALAIPALCWFTWIARRILPRLRRATASAQINAIFARLVLALVLLTLVTGLWASFAEGVLGRSRALRWHTVCVDALLPALVAHASLSIARWLARRAARLSPAEVAFDDA